MFVKNKYGLIIVLLLILKVYSQGNEQKKSINLTFMELKNPPEGIVYSNDRLGDGILYFAVKKEEIYIVELNNKPVMKKFGGVRDISNICFDPTISTSFGPKDGPWSIRLNKKEISYEDITSNELLILRKDKLQTGLSVINHIKLEDSLAHISQAMHIKDNFTVVAGIYEDKPESADYRLIRVNEISSKCDLISKNLQSYFDVDFESGKIFCIINDYFAKIDIDTLNIQKLHQYKLNPRSTIPFCRVFYFPKKEVLIINEMAPEVKLSQYKVATNELKQFSEPLLVRNKISSTDYLHCVNTVTKESVIIDCEGKILTSWKTEDKIIIGFFETEDKLIAIYIKKE